MYSFFNQESRVHSPDSSKIKNRPAPTKEMRQNENLNPDFEPPSLLSPSQCHPANVQQERF